MAEKAHDATDEILAGMESRLSAIYDQAHKEIEAKAAEYFEQFKKLDAQKRKLVDAGKLSEEEYKKWRRNKIMYGKHWTNLKAQLAEEYANVNRTAFAYINGKLPEVYALNYNDIGAELDDKVKGYSFELMDAQTVKNLATKDETLLPYKYLNGVKDVRWNTQKVNAAVLQGILHGESIPNLAKRLQGVTDMNKVSAIRNARTTITSAECKGRQDSYEKATKDGIKLKREWIAAIDGRTRHAHRLLDGQLADVDKPFKSELGDIMYPGDPEADPSNVYNCRCTIAAKVIGFNKVQVQKAMAEKQEKPKTMNQHYEPLSETEEKIDFISKELGVSREVAEQYNLAVAQYGGMSFGKIREASYIGGAKFDEVVFAGKYKSTYNEMAENIEQFIQRSPKWSGDIYRGANIPKSVLSSYKNGDVIDMMGVSSWTSNIDVADSYTYKTMDPRTIFHSSGTKQGTSIKHLAHYTQEDEVIVSSKTRWQIEKIEQIEDVTHIYVKELELG